MASRSFDGKVALLFREGHEWTNTLWRHLADSGGEPGAGRKKEAEWAVRNPAHGRD